jgi:dipeptidyl aminopeptidase/acylaminoacyl peptidase
MQERLKAEVARRLDEETHRRAELVSAAALRTAIRNLDPTIHWIAGRDAFWFKRESPHGHEFVLVDCVRERIELAFDHARLAATIAATTGGDVDAARLPIESLEFSAQGELARFHYDGQPYAFDRAAARCMALPVSPRAPAHLPAPDGRLSVFASGHDLWLRDADTGAERPLTQDGQEYFSWTAPSEGGLFRLRQMSQNLTLPPLSTWWSPNSEWVVASRTDDRKAPELPFVQHAPPDGRARPRAFSLRVHLASETERLDTEMAFFNVRDGRCWRVCGDELPHINAPELAWNPDGSCVYALYTQDGRRRVLLRRLDLHSGEWDTILEETEQTPVYLNAALYSRPNFAFLWERGFFIWFSERDGWGHLYLYDLAGKLQRRLTQGEWTVRDIVRLDGDKTLWFSASGKETGESPYHRHLYRLSLDGGPIGHLTPEPLDHHIPSPPRAYRSWAPGGTTAVPQIVSPSGRYFVDSRSTVEQPTRSAVRAADGTLKFEFCAADVSGVSPAAWARPVNFTAIADDNVTPLHGVMLLPPGFDAGRQYPVVEVIYGGPNMNATPVSFVELIDRNEMGLASVGFILLFISAQGTPLRSRKFREHIFECMCASEGLDTWAIADHVAVLKQLAQRYPFLDMERLGISGHSYGGYAAARALLAYPDVYRAAVSSAGPHDWQDLALFVGGVEFFLGKRVPPPPRLDNRTLVDRLAGRVLFLCGELDENAYPAATLRLVAACMRANKDVEMFYWPNGDHFYRATAYFRRKVRNFFADVFGA